MKIKTLVSLLLLAIAFLIGTYAANPAKAQGRGGGPSKDWKEIQSHMSIVWVDDGQGGMVKTIEFSGVNVRIVNGLGSTDSMNGTGNLVVGYNELGNSNGDDRRGSN